MTDRELLELAAKAYGIGLLFPSETVGGREPRRADTMDIWNPLTDDGDALRLAVKLGLHIDIFASFVNVSVNGCPSFVEVDKNLDRNAATRRAIVIAAAELGKAQP